MDQRIADRYVLRAVLGEGGMGTVYEGHDELLDRAVAVKQVRIPADVDEAERPGLRARVLREARAAARLNHPCATTVHDVVDTNDGVYIVMELASGRTLADVVAEQGPIDVQRAAGIGLALLDALQAAHERGIVHRDVKPSNVLLTPSGDTKLTDFGIATLQDEPAVASSPIVIGSPAFMAPEQAQGASSQPATDLWGLGATLYCALEGRAPFDRGPAAATMTAVVREETPVPRRAGVLAPLTGPGHTRSTSCSPASGRSPRPPERTPAVPPSATTPTAGTPHRPGRRRRPRNGPDRPPQPPAGRRRNETTLTAERNQPTRTSSVDLG